MMYALSKTPVSLEVAQSIISTHFGAQANIENFVELTDGMYNAAYKIGLAGEQEIVLKVAPSDCVQVLRYEKNIMQAEVEVLRLLHVQTDVPVPEVLAYDISHHLIDNDYYLMAFVPGVSMHKLRTSLSLGEQRAIDRRIGEYLRQMNAITNSNFGYFAQPEVRFDTWQQAFDQMLGNVLQDGQDADVELSYDQIYAEIRRYYHTLDEVTTPALVHWDLWDGNIFVDPGSKQITGVIDCERALWGDPLMEVNFGAFGLNPALLDGYGRDMLQTSAAKTRRLLYNIYLWLIMIIECTYRQYNTSDQENWVRPKLIEDMAKLERSLS